MISGREGQLTLNGVVKNASAEAWMNAWPTPVLSPSPYSKGLVYEGVSLPPRLMGVGPQPSQMGV